MDSSCISMKKDISDIKKAIKEQHNCYYLFKSYNQDLRSLFIKANEKKSICLNCLSSLERNICL